VSMEVIVDGFDFISTKELLITGYTINLQSFC